MEKAVCLDEQVIDLGRASHVTKGSAGIEVDPSTGRLLFVAGCADY